MTGRKGDERIVATQKSEESSWLWLREAWNVTDVNFLESRFHGFFED